MSADRASANGVLVIGETAGDVAPRLTGELIALGRQLCSDPEDTVSVLVLGDVAPRLPSQLIAMGADRVHAAAAGEAGVYDSDVWLAAVGEVLTRIAPRLIIAGHTPLGADLAPRLAFRLRAAIATGCERIELRNGRLHATRPCFGHKAKEVLSLRTTPAVATVRARSNEPLNPDPDRHGEVVSLQLPAMERSTMPRVRSRTRDDAKEGPHLETAKVVVAGGRGLGGAEGFAELAKLADALGGVVGASRVACDLGWCPHSWQIGLTGKTVTPNLYIAIGISGASHHMAGCGNSGAILAINSDPEAAIFKEARFGVVGDYREIVPALVREVARLKSQARE